MTKKVLIHIGSGKTGTSSIQDALFESEKRKDNILFSYPVIVGNGHQSIEVVFKDYSRITRGLKSRFLNESNEYKEFKSKFKSRLDEYTVSGNVLLSSEFMFGFSSCEVGRFKQYLEERGFSDFKVVVYLRSPSSYYLSLVQQKIKAAYRIPSPLDFKTNYYESIASWRNHFGDDVLIREFDKTKMLNGDVLQDFSTVINEFFGGNALLKTKPTNESITAEGMLVLQNFRKIFFKEKEDVFLKESNLLLEKIKEIELNYPGTKPNLKEKYTSAIMVNNRNDIKKINNQEMFNCQLLGTEAESIDQGTSLNDFSGSVYDLFESFDEDFYKYLLYRLVYGSLI